jgi:hypothetical protein
LIPRFHGLIAHAIDRGKLGLQGPLLAGQVRLDVVGAATAAIVGVLIFSRVLIGLPFV